MDVDAENNPVSIQHLSSESYRRSSGGVTAAWQAWLWSP